MKAKNFLFKLFSNGLVTGTIALGIGLLSMLALLKAYDAVWGEGPTSSVATNVAVDAVAVEEEGPVKTFHIRSLPVPFLNKSDGSELGFEWVDIAVDVAGEEAYLALEEDLGELKLIFSQRMKIEGAGRADKPGLVDFDRLAETFLKLAVDERGLRGIREVTISLSETSQE